MKAWFLALIMVAGLLGACTRTTKGGSFDLDDFPMPEDARCFYLSGYVSVPAEQVDEASSLLEASGVTSGPVSIEEVLNATSAEDAPPGLESIDGQLGAYLGLLALPDDDPYRVSLALRGSGLHASPIHVIGNTGHIRFKPGTEPTVIEGYELPEVTGRAKAIVAVVDTGIVAPEPDNPIPDWMFDGDTDSSNDRIRYDVFDEERLGPANPAGHGTFIAGLIRQISPTSTVSMARPRLVSTAPGIVVEQGEAMPGNVALTTELQVDEAIVRLFQRHQDDTEMMRALNLSLGTYTCDPTEDEYLVTIHAAIDKWLDGFGRSEVFAAAGNEGYRASAATQAEYVPFWPASLSLTDTRVHGVAAVQEQGEEIVWTSSGAAIVDPQRPWVTDWSPGDDLVGLAGGTVPGASGEVPLLVCWSGSSFATPVAAAQFANGISPAERDYDAVPGLTYVDPSTRMVSMVGRDQAPVQTGGCDHTPPE